MFGRIKSWFKYQYGGSREHLSVDEQVQIQLDDDSGWGSTFVKLLFTLFGLFLLSLLIRGLGLGFLSTFGVGEDTINKGEGTLLGISIVLIVLLFVALFGRMFFGDSYSSGHSYRDDHNPHIREMKERLKDR